MNVPVVWGIGGNDSGGGAGLSADQRATDAFGVHFCPVVAAVTAQHSRAVVCIEPMNPALIDTQLQALAEDMPPRVVKTGLLGGAAQVRVVAQWIDRLRESEPVALVIDPVLSATTGMPFVDAATLAAYRDELLPRATVITPNRREAKRLLGDSAVDDGGELSTLPELARRLRQAGVGAVCITGGDSADTDGRVLDWFAGEHAHGWLGAPRIATASQHGTGCTYASSIAAALALGFVPADAAVLAKMATMQALCHGHAAGHGAGPVRARAGFASDPSLLPMLSWGEEPYFYEVPRTDLPSLGLYVIVDSAERVRQVLAAGGRTLQLRIKIPAIADNAWLTALRDEISRSVAACREAGAMLFINDHWTLAQALGADGVHLGQEDLLAMSESDRQSLVASGMALGISTHSLWELCRARSLAPRYIACGPIWPTLTKAMPWQPQGLHNLRWWRHMAHSPVVAIGGILSATQVSEAAACGADGVCVVRAIGKDPSITLPVLKQALDQAVCRADSPAMPNPALITPWTGHALR